MFWAMRVSLGLGGWDSTGGWGSQKAMFVDVYIVIYL